MRAKIILFTLLFSFSALAAKAMPEHVAAPQSNEQDIQAIIDNAEKIKEQNNSEAEKIVQTVAKMQDSAEFKKHQNWIAKNQQEIFAKQTKPLPKVDYNISKNELEKDAIAKLLNAYRFRPDDLKRNQIIHYPLMIFVSSSIPKSSLKDLMIQAKQSGAILVFRGMVGSIKNTAKFLAEISKENVSAIIDPRLFDIFKVEVVPTFVVLGESIQDCGQDNCLITPRHDRIVGNITLEYALEQIIAGKGDAAQTASSYLAKIKQGQ